MEQTKNDLLNFIMKSRETKIEEKSDSLPKMRFTKNEEYLLNIINELKHEIKEIKQHMEWTRIKQFTSAAKNGNLENMKWLKENGCPWDANTFASAAKNGNLDNMKWLKENGCPWDANTFANTAEIGNFDNMKWLKENGCPWDERTSDQAAKNKHNHIVNWLREFRCPFSSYAKKYAAKMDIQTRMNYGY